MTFEAEKKSYQSILFLLFYSDFKVFFLSFSCNLFLVVTGCLCMCFFF